MLKKLTAVLSALFVAIAGLVAFSSVSHADVDKYDVVITKYDAADKDENGQPKDGAQQLAGAKFNVIDANNNVVASVETTTSGATVSLPVGKYTLVETQAPEGYTLSSEKYSFEVSEEVTTDSTIGNKFRATSSTIRHDLFWSSWAYTVTRNLTTNETVNETVYCVNVDKASPGYTNTYEKREGSVEALMKATEPNNTSSVTRPYSGEELRNNLLSVVYNGYPTNASGIKEKYNLSDNAFRAATQAAVWHTTNGRTRYQVDFDYYLSPNAKKAYADLIKYTQNVPDNMEANMYQVVGQENRVQSLMGSFFSEKSSHVDVPPVFNEKRTNTEV
ncbi:MAG: Cys-Gln thioester bond-forming surface protein, partial [Actinomycetaceae bacterium]|nr:Cys-Gln thioester bond-forming surface protein [Actinomycetaceae bacterium]